MKIVATSDTHGVHIDPREVPDGDVFVHCGDFTNYGRHGEIARFAAWLRELPHQHKLVIPGNHDLSFEDRTASEYDLGDGVEFLLDRSVTIDGVVFHGSPWTPRFGDWAFMYDGRIAEKIWSRVPDNTDVLITHGPGFGVLDKTVHGGFVSRTGRWHGENAGCVALANRIHAIRPKLHLHGHIHEARGELTLDSGTKVVNCATGGRLLSCWTGEI